LKFHKQIQKSFLLLNFTFTKLPPTFLYYSLSVNVSDYKIGLNSLIINAEILKKISLLQYIDYQALRGEILRLCNLIDYQ
jgi:hypothetical protein